MKFFLSVGVSCLLGISAAAQVTYSDNFSSSANYSTTGVAGTMWDGVYLGSGVSNPTGDAAGPASVSVANANITAGGILSVTSVGTDWENASDNGFLLFKVIAGDFDMSVRVVTPINSNAYNFPGLMVRAFGGGGSPAPNGAENSFLWARFNEYSIANMLKNNVNGAKTDTGEGTYPNTNYWLRITRAGNNFSFYERGPATAGWTNVATLTRSDLAGHALEVGIEQADFSGASLPAQFASFSLTVSNQTASATPTADTSLVATTNANNTVSLSWTPGSGTGSVVVLWTGNSAIQEMPSNGTNYTGNGSYGSGTSLPSTNYYVVYSGTGTSVVVSNLTAGLTYYAAAYGYSGTGVTRTYTHTAATGNFSLVFPAPPAPPSNFAMTTNANETISLTWTPGSGSTGSLVALWNSTNAGASPVNGVNYSGNASFGMGGALPGGQDYVVYTGANSSITVSNLAPGNTYDAAVCSYSGSGGTISYNSTPATAAATLSVRGLSGSVNLQSSDVSINFTSTPGKWYWLQYSDSLAPAVWINVGLVPSIATNYFMTLVQQGGAGAGQRFYRLLQLDPEFSVQTGNGTITSLERTNDVIPTQYLSSALGAVVVKYGVNGTTWNTVNTSPLSGATATYSTSPDGTVNRANYQTTTGLSGGPLVLESDFAMQQSFMTWTLGFTNNSASTVIVGDIAVQFPMSTGAPQYTTNVFKHSNISGSGSFIFWMRNNSVGPYLLMTPDSKTSFEYWDTLASGGSTYEAYIHSAVAEPLAAGQYPTVTNGNARWRLPTTSLRLAPGASTNYTMKFQWVNDYDGVRQALINEGQIDVHVVPGMTVPTNLFAEVALDTTNVINSITPEFPAATQLQALGSNGVYQLYRVQFSQLGENMLTVNYGSNQTMYLEFFVTEPIETLFKKRSGFLVSHQQWAGITNWYNGLFADWNENDQVRNSPDNYDTISGFVIYEVASDDAGESRPAYMGEKESVYPVQSEVSALDLYITNFVWPPGATGGLQRKTNETDSYGVYGIDNWDQLRSENTLSLGRTYDYPHLVDMWYSMYKVAKYNPQITTAWAATNYLEAAWGTALAMYTVAGAGNSTPGLMNEVVFIELLQSLQDEGMTSQYQQLLPYWESKVAFYATGNPNLFGSEYGFDSTGFEATEAFAKYALTHVGSDAAMGSGNPTLFRQEAENFMYTEVSANMFDRGYLERGYYHYGSDYRSGGSDNFCLSYMTQMGGWGLLDYALNYATNYPDYLRLGYGSFLAGWAIMNTGTAQSDYGFWYHGTNNDGACGGGYEPQAYFDTWLGQPTHRGPWYYSAEQNLGFCGAVRDAATVLADDPIFGRFCFGGLVQTNGSTMQIVPLDGIRRRFHALLSTGALHVMLDADRFASNQPYVLNSDLSGITVQIESDNPSAHTIPLHLSASVSEPYTIMANATVVASGSLTAGQDSVVQLPVQANANASPETFSISY